MELFSSLPARKDGTLKVTAKSGNSYVFTGSPLRCEVDDEGDVEYLQLLGFMDAEEFEAEAKFNKLAAAREQRRVAAGLSSAGRQAADDDGDGDTGLDSGDGAPVESGTTPTGRVRKATKASVVQS